MIKTLFKYLLANFILIGSGIFIFNSILLPLYVGYNNEHYVPDLRGQDKNKAISILKSMGYKIEIISRPFELINEPNTVLNISPRQFTKVKQGREIKLTVAGERKHVKVPNVIGKSERNATFIIERNELLVDTIYYEHSTEFMKGSVISQLPEIGDLRLTGYGVTLVVSKGNPPDYFVVPDLINLAKNKAEQKILEYGFQIGEIAVEFQPNLLEGTIIEQSLTPGMRLSFPARIDLRVSTDTNSYIKIEKEEIE